MDENFCNFLKNFLTISLVAFLELLGANKIHDEMQMYLREQS